MYNVASRFHTLAIADSPKTRIRIYFITDAVNCWDDNAVQTNGTLLVGAAGDTDSNGRIGQGGVTVTEIFNKDKNLTLGGTVSYQIGMTLVNSDGALNNFAFGRCKVYLDVYDDANSTWLPCPLGVFRIELPVKRKVQLISCTGYDQMQVLNAIADTWWNGLNFTGGLTIANILNSMVTQLGLHLSATSSTSMVNKTLSFTTPPIDSVERTYRDILGWIAEATGTVAHFNRDGELDMRQYLTPQIGGNNIVIDTDTTGNQCLSIDVAEYSVSQIDALTIKLTTADQGVTVGSGTNVYTIMDNPFLYGPDVATIQSKLTPIYNRLSAYATYSPISTRLIYDWSIEAGDIIYIRNNSTTYNMPIFQQKLVWRGGYVTAELISSGDTVRPQVSSNERETYRYNVEMATKVGDNEIISKINQTAEQIQIQASKVNLTGYITATNLATAGQTVINGGNITTGTISADRIAAGSLSISKLDSATQNTITTAASDASTALLNAATAQSTAESANSQEQLIYISRVSGTTTQSATTTWITDTTGNQNTWTIKRPTYNSSYPVLFVATQRKNVAGTVTCTTPQIDNTTTVIDGGHITTGTIDAGVVNVTNINASNITSGTMSADKISGGTLAVGGINNQNGIIRILDSSGNEAGSITNTQFYTHRTRGGILEESLLSSGILQLKTDGTEAALITRDTVGGGRIQLRDAAGTARLIMFAQNNSLELRDANGDPVIAAGNSSLNFFEGSGIPGLSLFAAGIDIRNKDGKPDFRIVRGATPYKRDIKLFYIDTNYHDAVELGKTDTAAHLRLYSPDNQHNIILDTLNGSTLQDTTVNGVLDVTQRRCYALLSSPGWYRVFTYACADGNQPLGNKGIIVDVNITKTYNITTNEVHFVKLLLRYNNAQFVDEESNSLALGITEVRYGVTGNNGYLDIYYDLTTSEAVCVDFSVYSSEPDVQSKIIASGFATATTPNNVLATYNFVADTGWKTDSATAGNTITLPSTWSELYYNARFNSPEYTYGFNGCIEHANFEKTTERYLHSYYGASNDYHSMMIEAGNTGIKIFQWKYNNIDYLSSSKLLIKYRSMGVQS